MNNLNDVPSTEITPSPENMWMESDEKRQETLMMVCRLIVKKFFTVLFNNRQQVLSDGVHDYSRHLFSVGCLYSELRDAIKEGDGTRVLQCWQYMPLFQNSGRKNYAIEAFRLIYQYKYGLPPKLAEQLIWSRFVNTQGVQGKNIPLDLHQEHLNKLCKTCIVGPGANKGEEAIVRCSKALGTLQNVLTAFDRNNYE